MKRSRFVALCLVLSLMLSYLIPVAYASNTPTVELGDIYVSGENAFCVYRNNDYTYCGHVNTSSVSGNFSIIYTNSPNTIYEYTFVTDPTSGAVESTEFWNVVLSECFSNYDQWNMRCVSDGITVSTPSAGGAQPYAVDPYVSQLTQKLQNIVGTAPYTGSITATAYKGGLIFHVYQDLTYYASVYNRITISEAMSVASIITSILAFALYPPARLGSALISIISLGFGAGTMIVSEGTTMNIYEVYAKWDRYVKRRDSSTWLTEAMQYTVSYFAYVNSNTGYCEIDTGSYSDGYAPSQAQYNDTAALLEKGYQYYLTLQ